MSPPQHKQQDRFFRGAYKRRLLRMAVNLVTCLGAGIASYSILVAFRGEIREAWLWIAAAILIDALDGTLIRNFQLQALCPEFDGHRLDEYADLVTFVIAPIAIITASGQMPLDWLGAVTTMAVVGGSCLQFAYKNAKTSVAFWGFPAYWNIVYFYAWALGLSSDTVVALSLGLLLCLFLPIPFIYPSRTPRARWLTVSLGVIWGGLLLYILWYPNLAVEWIYGSLFYPVYYIVLSLVFYSDLTEN